MNINKISNKKGFTLVELLLVISIIGLLASVVLASVSTARAKARDSRKIQDFKSIKNALYLYFEQNGSMPVAASQLCEGSAGYDAAMQQLITAKFLSIIPESPGGPVYCVQNFGLNNPQGFILQTSLETVPNSTTGVSPSCRPFAPGWCGTDSDKEYCICNPH